MFIGSDTQLVAPVTVGRGATLGAGTTLTRDAPPGHADRLPRPADVDPRLAAAAETTQDHKADTPCAASSARPRRATSFPVLIDGVRRLEYRGYDSTGLAVIDADGGGARAVAARQHRPRRRPRRAGRVAAARRHRRHLAHALGDARRADVDQRAPAHLGRRDRRRPQRHHRELRGAAGEAASAQGYALRHRDRHRGHRASRALALARDRRRRPAARRARRRSPSSTAPTPSR